MSDDAIVRLPSLTSLRKGRPRNERRYPISVRASEVLNDRNETREDLNYDLVSPRHEPRRSQPIIHNESHLISVDHPRASIRVSDPEVGNQSVIEIASAQTRRLTSRYLHRGSFDKRRTPVIYHHDIENDHRPISRSQSVHSHAQALQPSVAVSPEQDVPKTDSNASFQLSQSMAEFSLISVGDFVACMHYAVLHPNILKEDLNSLQHAALDAYKTNDVERGDRIVDKLTIIHWCQKRKLSSEESCHYLHRLSQRSSRERERGQHAASFRKLRKALKERAESTMADLQPQRTHPQDSRYSTMSAMSDSLLSTSVPPHAKTTTKSTLPQSRAPVSQRQGVSDMFNLSNVESVENHPKNTYVPLPDPIKIGKINPGADKLPTDLDEPLSGSWKSRLRKNVPRNSSTSSLSNVLKPGTSIPTHEDWTRASEALAQQRLPYRPSSFTSKTGSELIDERLRYTNLGYNRESQERFNPTLFVHPDSDTHDTSNDNGTMDQVIMRSRRSPVRVIQPPTQVSARSEIRDGTSLPSVSVVATSPKKAITKHQGFDKLADRNVTSKSAGSGHPERISLLLDVYTFYSVCRQTIEFASCALDQQFASDVDLAGTASFSFGSATEDSQDGNNISRKRSSDDTRDPSGEDDDRGIIVARKKPRRREAATSEFPCWWYIHDPVRYEACGNFCSRKRDLHSYRRHHFEDHWRWGDVQSDGISFDQWYAAKHAICDVPDLNAEERDYRKWERTYQIYFGLREGDLIPRPVCSDPKHLHYRPKRPIKCQLPLDQSKNLTATTPGQLHHKSVSSPTENLTSCGTELPFLDSMANQTSTAPLFPEMSNEQTDPFASQDYFTAWNDRFHVASDIVHTVSSSEILKLVVDDHISRIKDMLQSLYNEPQKISRNSIATVLELARNFETDISQTCMNENILNCQPGSTYDLAIESCLSYGEAAVPTTRGKRRQSLANLEVDIPPYQNTGGHSDGQTSGSEFMNEPSTPSPRENTFSAMTFDDANEQVAIPLTNLEHSQTKKSADVSFGVPDVTFSEISSKDYTQRMQAMEDYFEMGQTDLGF